ncbi:hypothetical protein E2493_14520 [Sphingomonas parva]|uniref:DUF4915 domain-containing protein n=1 Tax=Sphingomonas parva TaxID=2555898 RepID=A0A4Y8ZQ32_9SPHN|nr:hypothetical protein [Sphingomonas parva]TFI57577.1 hypothetical protein E2493_14520 [Sphingomonas parva]
MAALRIRKRHLAIAAAIIAAAVCAVAATRFWRDAAPAEAGEEDLQRIVFADGRLWMLTIKGHLLSLAPDEAEPRRSAGKTIDICRLGDGMLALAQRGEVWRLRLRTDGRWRNLPAVPTEGDTLVALGCEGEQAMLVTSRRLIDLQAGTPRAVRLNGELQRLHMATAAPGDAEFAWIGFNVGEWGGGLMRIHRRSGRLEKVHSNRSGEICGGPLNTDCDPVNGIVASPSDPSCAVAAIGMLHMMSHGRIVEVCGTRIRRLYFKALAPQPPAGTLDEGEPSSTVSFFGLALAGGDLWAVGIDGLHRLRPGQPPQFRPLPKFTDRGGYMVSFDVPGVVLVLSNANQRVSLSGAIPLMAVR